MKSIFYAPILIAISGCWLLDPGRNKVDKGPSTFSLIDDSRPFSIYRINNRAAAIFNAHSPSASFCEIAVWPQSQGANRPASPRIIACADEPHFSHQVTINGLDPAVVYWFEASFGFTKGDWKISRKSQESASDETTIAAQTQNSNIALAKVNHSFGTLSMASVFGFPGQVPKISEGCMQKEPDLQSIAGKSTPSKIGWISIGDKKSENEKPATAVSMQIPGNIALQTTARLQFDLGGTSQSVDLPKAPTLTSASISSISEIGLTRVRLGSAAQVEWQLADTATARWQTQNLDSDAYLIFDARVRGSIEGFSCVFNARSGSANLPVDQLRKIAPKPMIIQMKLVTYRALSASNKLPVLTSYEDSRRRLVLIK